jgi:hypothetical protein
MKTTITSLSLLGASLGTGMVLSLAPVTSVYAGTFERNVMDENGNKMGHIKFSWDETTTRTNVLEGFNSLTDFSLTDYANKTYDLQFAKSALYQLFEFNIDTQDIETKAYNLSHDTNTKKDGFELTFITSDFANISSDGSSSSDGNVAKFSPSVSDDNTVFTQFSLQEPQPEDPQPESVPESGTTTALLVLAGLVLICPKKKL